MEDLIPHKESLKVLYQLEEFQVLLSFLSSLRKQKEAEVWMYQQSVNGKEGNSVKVEIAVMLAQRNLIAMLETLPEAVSAVESVIERQKEQAHAFQKAQDN
jgi:hypothetical protein